MLTNKKYQQLLSLAATGKPLDKDATDAEKKFYKECKCDYKVIKLCLKPQKNME